MAELPPFTSGEEIPSFTSGDCYDWKKWKAAFEVISEREQWSDREVAYHLSVAIRGHAHGMLKDNNFRIPTNQRGTILLDDLDHQFPYPVYSEKDWEEWGLVTGRKVKPIRPKATDSAAASTQEDPLQLEAGPSIAYPPPEEELDMEDRDLEWTGDIQPIVDDFIACRDLRTPGGVIQLHLLKTKETDLVKEAGKRNGKKKE